MRYVLVCSPKARKTSLELLLRTMRTCSSSVPLHRRIYSSAVAHVAQLHDLTTSHIFNGQSPPPVLSWSTTYYNKEAGRKSSSMVEKKIFKACIPAVQQVLIYKKKSDFTINTEKMATRGAVCLTTLSTRTPC